MFHFHSSLLCYTLVYCKMIWDGRFAFFIFKDDLVVFLLKLSIVANRKAYLALFIHVIMDEQSQSQNYSRSVAKIFFNPFILLYRMLTGNKSSNSELRT